MNKIIKIKILLGILLFISFLSVNSLSFAEELKWEKTVLSAFYKAMSQKKKIVLFVGRESCPKCRYMKTRVFEAENPPVKALLEDHFVLWLSDADKSKEWHPVAKNLSEIPLPLICIIDPDTGKAYEDRTTGIQEIQEFYSLLLKHTGS